jgi:lipoic acid synthetase
MHSAVKHCGEPAKPAWIRVRLPSGPAYEEVRDLKHRKQLHTVCESALCPNIGECWQMGHATFMILGDGCTRNCRFCAVGDQPAPPDPEEPRRVAEAVRSMGLKHAVITSVTRDDLPDGGAGLFAATITAIRRVLPETTVEVLIPDFQGSRSALDTVMAAGPDILGHNVETVPRIYYGTRPKADYQQSLTLLKNAKTIAPEMITKSGIMLGLGETESELLETIAQIRTAGADILTLGQYLRPGPAHLPVQRYYPPEEFESLKARAEAMGFSWVEAGPLVRSSYRAERQARALCKGRQGI